MNRTTMVSIGSLILRLAFGFFMMVHGWEKLSSFVTLAETFPDPLGMGNQLSLIFAIGAELGCSILLILGFSTRIVVLPLAFTMCVALFMVHGNGPWKKQELAACYLAVYFSILFLGPGMFSIDHLLFGRSKQVTTELKVP